MKTVLVQGAAWPKFTFKPQPRIERCKTTEDYLVSKLKVSDGKKKNPARVVEYLAAHQGQTVPQVAAGVKIDQHRVGCILSRLEAKRLVRTELGDECNSQGRKLKRFWLITVGVNDGTN